MAENRNVGTFNVTGPNYELMIEELLNTCKKVTKSDAKFVWVEERFIREHNVQPWTEIPLWIPEFFPMEGETEPWKGTFSINIEKAVNAGLSFRSLEDISYDVYQWEKFRPESERKAGISREREQELLKVWFQKVKKETV